MQLSTHKCTTWRCTRCSTLLSQDDRSWSDITTGDGRGGESIYGRSFADEQPWGEHDRKGLLSMANSGPASNGCQFFVTCDACDWLDNKHVVFGKVVDGMLTVRKIEAVAVGANSKPKLPIVVTQSGEM